MTQPDEDSKAVRFRRHTIRKEYQNGTRFVQHTSRHSSDCLPHEARERRRGLERTRMGTAACAAFFHRCSALHCTCTPPHRVAHATLDRCIDPAAVCSHPPSWSPLLMGAWTPGIERSPQSAAAPLLAQQTNNCSKLCPMDVAVTSVRRSDRMHRFADSGQACPSRLSICPLFGCAGHS